MSTNPNLVPTTIGGAEPPYRRDLTLLRTTLAILDSSLELDQILTRVLRTLLKVHGNSNAGLVLANDPLHPGFEVLAHQGLPADGVPRRIFIDECPCRQAIETAMPFFEPRCSGWSCLAGLEIDHPHSHLIIPLKSRQRVLGLICIHCRPDFEIEDWDLSLWEDLGIQIGKRIEDSRLQTQLQQDRELLYTLYAVSDHLAASLDMDWVLSRVLDLSISATNARDGSIFLLPTPEGRSSRILRRDLPASEADQVVHDVLTHGVAGWVVRHQEGTIVPDAAADPKWYAFPDDPQPPGSALAVPLVSGDRILGVITLDHNSKDHFRERDLALMTAIAHQASSAIEKARLHNEVTHLADILAERVKKRTRELRETQAQLIQAEKLAALGELSAGIAHEINNPLHILQAYLDYIASQAREGDMIVEFLDPMRSALETITRLAIQLRDFSRPTEGEWKPMDLNQALDNVLRLVNKELAHCNVEVNRALAPYLPSIKGDIRQMEQVFLNLILNARDAMPGGGRLTIETRADTDAVYACVADTGVGIHEENLARIFEPYFTTKEARGTGLGLAICQRVLAQHGGKITVASQLGRGTSFTIYLPIEPRRRSFEAEPAPATQAEAREG